MKLNIGSIVRFKTLEALMNTAGVYVDNDNDISFKNENGDTTLLLLEREIHLCGKKHEIGSSYHDYNDAENDEGYSIYETNEKQEFCLVSDPSTYYHELCIEEIMED